MRFEHDTEKDESGLREGNSDSFSSTGSSRNQHLMIRLLQSLVNVILDHQLCSLFLLKEGHRNVCNDLTVGKKLMEMVTGETIFFYLYILTNCKPDKSSQQVGTDVKCVQGMHGNSQDGEQGANF